MNQVFNFQRFTLFINKHWAENKKRYALSVIASVGLLMLWFVFMMLFDNSPEFSEKTQKQVYFFCLFLGGAVYASQFFRDLGSRPKGTNFLLTPASTLEKFLCSLLYSTILFFIMLTASFYLVDVVMIYIANLINMSSGHSHVRSDIANVFHVQNNDKNIAIYLFLAFLSVQSLFLLGSIYFSKYSFIKTIIVVFILFLVVVALEAFYMKSILRGHFGDSIITYNVQVQPPYHNYEVVQLPTWILVVIVALIKYAIPLFLWSVTYFRLREKEI